MLTQLSGWAAHERKFSARLPPGLLPLMCRSSSWRRLRVLGGEASMSKLLAQLAPATFAPCEEHSGSGHGGMRSSSQSTLQQLRVGFGYCENYGMQDSESGTWEYMLHANENGLLEWRPVDGSSESDASSTSDSGSDSEEECGGA